MHQILHSFSAKLVGYRRLFPDLAHVRHKILMHQMLPDTHHFLSFGQQRVVRRILTDTYLPSFEECSPSTTYFHCWST